jgi:hypothetical protein
MAQLLGQVTDTDIHGVMSQFGVDGTTGYMVPRVGANSECVILRVHNFMYEETSIELVQNVSTVRNKANGLQKEIWFVTTALHLHWCRWTSKFPIVPTPHHYRLLGSDC